MEEFRSLAVLVDLQVAKYSSADQREEWMSWAAALVVPQIEY
jgi:hypothetical protein